MKPVDSIFLKKIGICPVDAAPWLLYHHYIIYSGKTNFSLFICFLREKSCFHHPTIIKVRFSTRNYIAGHK